MKRSIQILCLLILGSPPAFAQLSENTKGILKLDVQVQDELGIDTVSQVVQLKHIKASEIEPFIRARLSRWGAVQVNDALNMVVITDKRIKLNDLIDLVRKMDSPQLKDFLRLETASLPLDYTDPHRIRDQVAAQLSPEGRLIVDEAHNALVVTDLKSKVDLIKNLITTIDVFIPQVHVDVSIVEISEDHLRKVGLDWDALRLVGGNASAQLNSHRNNPLTETTLSTSYGSGATVISQNRTDYVDHIPGSYPPWNITGYFDLNKFFNIVNVMSNDNRANLVTSTRIMVANNQTGTVSAGETVHYRSMGSNPSGGPSVAAVNNSSPYYVSYPSGGTYYNSGSSNTTPGSANVFTPEDKQVGGLQVQLRPRIGKENSVSLEIDARLDNLIGWSPEGNPIFDQRALESQVTLRDGETFVLGGFKRTTSIRSSKGIPVLKSILPFFFSKEVTTSKKYDVLVLLTPHIKREPGHAPAEEMEKYERMKP